MSDDDFTSIGVRPEDLEDDAPYRRGNYPVPAETTEPDHRVPHEAEVLDFPELFPRHISGPNPGGRA
jgi:hypothetical protein